MNSVLSNQGAGRNTQGRPIRGDLQQLPCDAKVIVLLSLHAMYSVADQILLLPFENWALGWLCPSILDQVKATWLIQLLLAWPLLPYSVFCCICPLRWLSLPLLYQPLTSIPLCCSHLPGETQRAFYICAHCPALIAPAFSIADSFLPCHPVDLCTVSL